MLREGGVSSGKCGSFIFLSSFFFFPADRMMYLRDRVGGNLMTGRVEILNLAVVGPLVGDVERGRDGATVRIFPPFLEQIGVQALVQIVHGIVERQENDLRYLLRKVVTYFFFFFFSRTGRGGGRTKGRTCPVRRVYRRRRCIRIIFCSKDNRVVQST